MSSLTGAYPTKTASGHKITQIPRMSPQWAEMAQQLRGAVQPGIGDTVGQLQGIASGGNDQIWNRLEAPALRQFSGVQGNIASRFSAGGGQGQGQSAGSLRNSSGFQNTMGEQAASLAEQLQSQRMGFQQSAQEQLLRLYRDLMGNDPYDQFTMEKEQKTPWWKKILGGALPIAGAVGGSFIPGLGIGAGALAGSSLSKAILG